MSDPISLEDLKDAAIREMRQELEAREKEVAGLTAQKNGAYSERNKLVAALSKLFPASLERHEGADWEDDWRWVVFIDLPTGQASWHIHDSELRQFDHLPNKCGRKWDGHSNEEKYARLAALPIGSIAQALRAESARTWREAAEKNAIRWKIEEEHWNLAERSYREEIANVRNLLARLVGQIQRDSAAYVSLDFKLAREYLENPGFPGDDKPVEKI
jgi:hypothetical protein